MGTQGGLREKERMTGAKCRRAGASVEERKAKQGRKPREAEQTEVLLKRYRYTKHKKTVSLVFCVLKVTRCLQFSQLLLWRLQWFSKTFENLGLFESYLAG